MRYRINVTVDELDFILQTLEPIRAGIAERLKEKLHIARLKPADLNSRRGSRGSKMSEARRQIPGMTNGD